MTCNCIENQYKEIKRFYLIIISNEKQIQVCMIQKKLSTALWWKDVFETSCVIERSACSNSIDIWFHDLAFIYQCFVDMKTNIRNRVNKLDKEKLDRSVNPYDTRRIATIELKDWIVFKCECCWSDIHNQCKRISKRRYAISRKEKAIYVCNKCSLDFKTHATISERLLEK